jgi:hypothetical protein
MLLCSAGIHFLTFPNKGFGNENVLLIKLVKKLVG